MRKLLVYWVPLVGWFLVVFNLSSTPGNELPRLHIPHFDKLFHAAEYFLLSVLMVRAMDASFGMSSKEEKSFKAGLAKLSLLTIIISLYYSIFDEWYQIRIPGRSCDFFDLFADCIGIFTGVFIYNLSKKFERRR